MAQSDYDQIVKRAAWGLGPGWRVGDVRVVGDVTLITPVYEQDVEARDFITLSWPPEQDYEVSQGRGSILAFGEYPRRGVFEQKSMDEIAAWLREKVPEYHAAKKQWFGRG